MGSFSESTGDLVLFGIGKVSEVITVYLEKFSDFNIVAYTVDQEYLPKNSEFNEKPVVAWSELGIQYPPGSVKLMGPLTYKRLNRVRRDRYLEAKGKGYEFASFIHPASHVAAEKIGDHVIVLEQTVVQPFAEIGNNVIIWSNSIVAHHSKIGDHCFLSSEVGVSSSVVVGEECFLGGQTGIGHEVTIGDRCILANDAWASQDLADDSVLTGPRSQKKTFASNRLARLI